MQTDGNGDLDESIFDSDENIYADEYLINHTPTLSKPSKTIDSILSLDDTVLRIVEDEINNEALSPGLHEKTLDALKHEFNEHSFVKSSEPFKKPKDVQPNIHNKGTRDQMNNLDLNKSCNLFENESQWQDNTFMNQAFTQFNTNNKTDSVENKNPIKRSPTPQKHVVPEKKFCQGEKANNCSFYGLPNNVKTLIFKTKKITALYDWQDECLNLDAIKNRKNLIYALPTSGGKTLVAEILMLKELVCNKRNAILVLPFVAIVQEKVQSMAPFALELGFLVEEYASAKGTYPPKKRRKKNSVYICTIEKALGLINSLIEEKRLNEIGIIVVDELHLLGEGGGRGATLEGLLTKVLYLNADVQIVGMSATIGNLYEIAQFLNAELYTGNFRPVQIKEYIKCEDNIWLADLNAEELLTDLKKVNYRYSKATALLDPDQLGGLVMDVVPNDSCLLFCANRKNCENVALLLSKVLFRSLGSQKKEEKEVLLNALRTEEGLCPTLEKTIPVGVAYHHSGLTSEERRLLEDAFRVGTLCVICCTSTLAAGVNLPARRVIIRSPYVGTQFLNLSRYKQMIGRAGRAGMKDTGESILVCKSIELRKVKEMLTSSMDDSLSTLHTEKDRGINNLILSAVLLCIATTRSELHKLTAKTLLSIQQKRLDANTKSITDEALTKFVKSGVMKVKKTEDYKMLNKSVNVVIPSQGISSDGRPSQVKGKKVITLTSRSELELCPLGRAAMKGCIDMHHAYILYQDLKVAQKHLILSDCLHLLYLVTPYDISAQIKPVGIVYHDAVMNLSETQMETARLLGIDEVTVSKLRTGIMPKNVESRIIQRFYVTLILYELWTHHAVYILAEKYQISRGIIQNLLSAVSSFSMSVVRFCEELDEFWAFKDLLKTFSKRLAYFCPSELEALMELPAVKIGRARQLYNAGYKTVQCIAKANPGDLQEKIPYLNKRVVIQIIEAAKLLILAKVEDLKDEAEDVLDGMDVNNIRRLEDF